MIKTSKLLILFLCFIFLANTTCLAGPLSFLSNKVVMPTFKVITKAYIYTLNIKTIRVKCIRIIKRLDKEELESDYALVYPYLKKCSNCGEFPEKIGHKKAIDILKTIDKSRISRMIAATPNDILRYAFRKYVLKRKNSELK